MATKCVSGKKVFSSQEIAEDVLIELWTKNEYTPQHAPIAVYRCDDCGLYHLTSSGAMNDKLAAYLKSKNFQINKEASKWLDRFKGR